MLLCLITDNVTLDHLVKVIFARFLYYKVIIFLAVINKYLSADILRLSKCTISPQIFVY